MIRLCFLNATQNKILPKVRKYGVQASNWQKFATRHYHQSGFLHSQTARMKPEEEQQIRHEILKAALAFVPECGWTQKSISNGALSVGLVEMSHGLFQYPGAELVQYFNTRSNEALVQNISASKKFKFEFTNPNNRNETLEFLRSAVQKRLQMILPYISKWPQVLQLHTPFLFR
jgi:ubiquinone biosynthesis protein COQ9